VVLNSFELNTLTKLYQPHNPGRRCLSIFMSTVTLICTLITVSILITIVFYIVNKGIEQWHWDLFTQLPPSAGMTGGGIANALIGTVWVVTIGSTIAFPTGILAAIYLAEFAQATPLTQGLRLATLVLSGLPSIIAGVFVYGLLVATGITGFSAIAGGVALAVLMLPIVTRFSEEAIRLVPQDLRWGAIALGASQSQVILGIVLPAAAPAILTGILLALSRAVGETAPLLFTALNSSFWPQGLWEPTPTLSVLIYHYATSPFAAQKELAWAAAFVLVFSVLITNLLSRFILFLTFRSGSIKS